MFQRPALLCNLERFVTLESLLVFSLSLSLPPICLATCLRDNSPRNRARQRQATAAGERVGVNPLTLHVCFRQKTPTAKNSCPACRELGSRRRGEDFTCCACDSHLSLDFRRDPSPFADLVWFFEMRGVLMPLCSGWASRGSSEKEPVFRFSDPRTRSAIQKTGSASRKNAAWLRDISAEDRLCPPLHTKTLPDHYRSSEHVCIV